MKYYVIQGDNLINECMVIGFNQKEETISQKSEYKNKIYTLVAYYMLYFCIYYGFHWWFN